MKTTKLFLTIILLFALKTSMAQETWYPHVVMVFGNQQLPNINSVSIIYNDFGGIICGDSGYIANWQFFSEDYWSPNFNLITHQNLNSVYIVDSLDVHKAYMAGDSGKIFKTNDIPLFYGDIPFYSQNSPTANNLYSIFFNNYLEGIAVGDTGTVVRTTDGGSHWNLISSITQNRLYSVQFPSTNLGYAVGVNGTVIKTTDGGGNWVMKTQAIADTLRCVWFTDDNTGFVVSRNGAIYKTTDGGNNWQSKPSGITQNINAIRFASTNIGYAAGNNDKVLRTTDAGETWIIQAIAINQANYKGISTSNYGQVYIVGSNGNAIGNFPEPGSIQKYWNNGEVKITPNPAKDYLTINLQNNKNYSGLALSIYNIQGQILLQHKLKQNNSEIDISQLREGIYIAKIRMSDGSFRQGKFVVVR